MPSQLFSKFKMRDLELANRIVVSPMGHIPAIAEARPTGT